METTRFAPSPTGLLHTGHIYAALVARRAAGPAGRLLLRLEDIDRGRCRPRFAAAILEDLAWLGLAWTPPWLRQSDRTAAYAAALDRLRGDGLLYPCFCSRKDIAAATVLAAPHGTVRRQAPVYPGTCRRLDPGRVAAWLDAGRPHAWRLDMAAACNRHPDLDWHERGSGWQPARPARFGDVVLARKDIATSYHLAVTVDDAFQGVTLVTRGADLRPVTDIHRLLQALLGLPVPAWAHHPLKTDRHGKRLAKREGAASIAGLREAGVPAAQVLALAMAAPEQTDG